VVSGVDEKLDERSISISSISSSFGLLFIEEIGCSGAL
jgi:hypothetical protein